MKFGKVRINASTVIALLAVLYILMVCKEKYFIEYAEGEPVKEEVVTVETATGKIGEYADPVVTAETTAPVVTAESAPKKEGMSTGAIASISVASILVLIAIMIMFMRFRRRY